MIGAPDAAPPSDPEVSTLTPLPADAEVLGPIDYILLEFPGDRPLDETAAALAALVESGQIALYDLLAVRKEVDGSVSGIALDQIDRTFAVFEGARSGLLGDDDMAAAADAMDPGTRAVLIVFENRWAAPFVAAAWRAGGELIASARIPAADILAVLDELDQS